MRKRRLMVEINVHCPVDLAQAVLPDMKAQQEGWIVNLSSASSAHPSGPPYDLGGVRGVYGFYGATKAMLNRVTTAMASELHTAGVRVNTVEPRAAVLSEGADEVMQGRLTADQIESMEAMCEAALFLCDCGPDHTGRVESSLDLLTREDLTVMNLDGTAPHPGGVPPVTELTDLRMEVTDRVARVDPRPARLPQRLLRGNGPQPHGCPADL